MAIRVTVTIIAVLVGWVAGVYTYLGLLYVFDDGPQPGDIHIGGGVLGLAGMIGAGLGAWRWSTRFDQVLR